MKIYRYEVLRDGEILATFDTYENAMRYLLKIQPHSMMWACEHEGYAITEQKETN